MAMIVSIECPSCVTAFPVDPDKVPHGGARTECTVCGTPFAVDPTSWTGDGTGADAWAPSEPETDALAVHEDSDVDVDEFAPVEDRWSVESDHDQDQDPAADTAEAGGADSDMESSFGEALLTDEAQEPSEFAELEAATPAEGEFEASIEAEGGFGDSGFDVGEVEAVESMETVEGVESAGGFESVEEVESAEEFESMEEFEEFESVEGLEPVEGVESVEGAESVEALPSAFDAPTSGFTEAISDEISVEGDSGVEPEIDVGADAFTSAFDSEDVEISGGTPQTGEIVTDQWADLVDGDAQEDAEISSDWGGDDGVWVVETDDGSGLEIGEIEVERLDTVEEHVRAAQDDPDLTEPAEGVDTNELSSGAEGFGDFMTGGETMLPEDALEAGGPGLHLDGDGAGDGEFVVEEPVPEAESEGPEVVVERTPELPDAGSEMPAVEGVVEEVGTTFQFGRRDPHDKARRLARVLVSDMITYNPDRHAQALQNGSVKADFEDEIEKSWAEYVEQVGPEIAESTDYWRDALNEILAGDEALF